MVCLQRRAVTFKVLRRVGEELVHCWFISTGLRCVHWPLSFKLNVFNYYIYANNDILIRIARHCLHCQPSRPQTGEQ
jgi:hypothetical protein